MIIIVMNIIKDFEKNFNRKFKKIDDINDNLDQVEGSVFFSEK